MRIAFRFVMCFAWIFFLPLAVVISFVVGGLIAEQNCYARYYSARQKDVRNAIDDIGVSSSIGIERDSVGRVVLVGFVDSEDELNRIQVSLTPVLGNRDAKHAMASISIGKTLSGFGQSR